MNISVMTALTAAVVTFALPLTVPAKEPVKEPVAEAAKEQDQAQLEAKLEAARARLEAAAREVGELSAQVHGPMSQNFFMARQMRHHAMIGIGIGRGDDEKASGKADGVYVESVTPGGPAADAGIKVGDVIVSIDGEDLRKAAPSPHAALMRKLRETKPGEKVKVDYVRGGKTHTVQIATEAMKFGAFTYGPGDRVFGAQGRPVPGSVPPAVSGGSLPPGAPSAPTPPMAFFRGWAGQGVLDMELVTLTPKLGRYFGADRGVLVVRAPRDSSFKLEEGDVILDIDGREPQSGAHAMRILRSYQRGENVQFNVLRDKKKMKLSVKVPRGEEFGARWEHRGFDPADNSPEIMPLPEPYEAPVPPPPPLPPVAGEVM